MTTLHRTWNTPCS